MARKGWGAAGLLLAITLAGCASRPETSCIAPWDYPLPAEAHSTHARVLATWPELRGLILSAPERTAEMEIESRRKRPAEVPDSTILPGQAMSVEVLGEPEFTRLLSVNVDGAIEYPLLGCISVAGRTRNDVKADLTQRLRKYLRDPQVFLNLGRIGCSGPAPSPWSRHRVRVLGEVLRPGDLQHEPGLRASGAIMLSGWFTETSERREVWVIRPRIGRRRASLVVCDFQQLLIHADLAQDVPLGENDIVYVAAHSTAAPHERPDWKAAIRYLAGQTATSDLLAALGGGCSRTTTPPPLDDESAAIRLIERLPETLSLRARFSGPNGTSRKTGGTLHVASHGEEKGLWTIQVYEDVPGDEPGEGHTATSQWYEVDLSTSTARPLLDFEPPSKR